MTATYGYSAHGLVGNELIRDLPLVGVKYSKRLNGIGDLSASLPLPSPTTTAARSTCRSMLGALEEDRTALYVYRDGVIVWGGILDSLSYDSAAEALQLRASEFWAYFGRREIRWDADYLGVDQLAIAQDLVTTAQASPGGDIGVTVGSETSGVLRDFTSWGYQATKVAQAVEQIARARDGFDFTVDVDVAAGVITKTLRLSYPRRGRTSAATGLVFDYDRRDVSRVRTSTAVGRAANSVYLAGAGEGFTMVSTVVADTAPIDGGYPLLEDTFAAKDVDDDAQLALIGREELRTRSTPPTVLTISTFGDTDPVIGSYIVGDEVRVIIPAGNLARFPDGLDGTRRIAAFTVAVPDGGGGEPVEISFADPVAS